jgi:phage recombination protein Bet
MKIMGRIDETGWEERMKKNEIVTIEKSPWSLEQIQLIKDVVAKNATDDELKLFLYRCKNLGLDPLKPGQIHFIKYGNSPGTIVVGIEGFRSRASTTGKLTGIKRGILRDDKGKCTGAWAEVFRSDWKEPAHEEVSLSEYNTGKSNWARMPETMIKKVAEAAALRMAFPDQLGGVYTNEEMDQANHGTVYPEQPSAEDGHPDPYPSYRIPGGQFAKRGLHEIEPKKLADYIESREKALKDKPEKKPEWWDDFVYRAEQYLGELENQTTAEIEGTQE